MITVSDNVSTKDKVIKLKKEYELAQSEFDFSEVDSLDEDVAQEQMRIVERQMEEIVTCKDCHHFNAISETSFFCRRYGSNYSSYIICSPEDFILTTNRGAKFQLF